MREWKVTFIGEDNFQESIEIRALQSQQALHMARAKSKIHEEFLKKVEIERIVKAEK